MWKLSCLRWDQNLIWKINVCSINCFWIIWVCNTTHSFAWKFFYDFFYCEFCFELRVMGKSRYAFVTLHIFILMGSLFGFFYFIRGIFCVFSCGTRIIGVSQHSIICIFNMSCNVRYTKIAVFFQNICTENGG